MIKDTLKSIISVVPPQFRKHPTYGKYYRLIKKSVGWSKETLHKKQLIELRRLVYLAYTNTKGYRQLYKEHGIQPSDIQSLDDIKHLPIVNKTILSDNIKDFSVMGPQHRLNSTGGTTGHPFQFYLSRATFAAEAAFIHAYWEAYKWKLGRKSAVLRGSFIGDKNKVTRFSNYAKELYLSSYQLSSDNLDKYISAVKKYKPAFLQAYPSALSLLCDLIEEKGSNEFDFKAFFLGSENIYPWQIEKIKQTFPNAAIHSWYGLAEKNCYATLIPSSDLQYEVQPLYGIAEPGAPTENGLSEIIATGFINTSTPFIRYQTNDYAEFGSERPKNCLYDGSTIIKRIDGREQEMVITKSMNYLSMASFSIHEGLFKNIKQFQVHQKKQGEITLNYIPASNFKDDEESHILKELKSKFLDDLDINLKKVEEIKRADNGKFRYLIQELDIKHKA